MGMTRCRFAVAGCAVAMLAVSLGAQQTPRTTRPLTMGQLQAKVRALEDENAVLARNYDLLLASCRSRVPADALPTRPSDSAKADVVTPSTPSKIRRPRNVDDDLFWVEELNYGVTETTTNFLRFGWKVTVHNGLDRNEDFTVTVQFLNKDDLVIGSTRLIGQAIRALDEQTITGDTMIGVPAAYDVASAKVTVNRYR
jgi:hypothetical protein